MRIDDNTQNVFFQLLRLGLRFGVSKVQQIPEGVNWEVMYQLASEQSVLGIVLAGIDFLPNDQRPPKIMLLQWIGEIQMLEQQNHLINKELFEFDGLCRENRCEYVVVKGQTVGCLYAKPEWRQAGDIDFLIHSSKYRVQDYAEALGVDIPKMLEKEVGFSRNGQRYELHTSLRTWAKREHQKEWDALIEKEWEQEHYVEIEGVKVRTLSPTINAAYIFIHLFFHFMREGVSLRQFCDWAVILHHYREVIGREAILQVLLDLSLLDAYRAFETILVDKLGLPLRELPVPISDDDQKWQGKILNDVFKGGNFGYMNHKAHSSWKYKMETMGLAVKNSFKYYRLCPSEVGGMIPRLVKGNMKILMNR